MMHWNITCSSSTEMLSSAVQNYHRSPNSLIWSAIADIAHHHSDTNIKELCLLCEVEVHLSFLDAVMLAWNSLWGVALRPRYTQTMSPKCLKLLEAWHKARLQLQELREIFVVMATDEEA